MYFDIYFYIILFNIIICFIFMYYYKNKKTEKKEILDYNENEYIFFKNIYNGKPFYKLLSIYTPFDLMMIRSFFISENIPYYVEFEHLMKVYPFIHGENYNNTNIYILYEDYNDAIFIINNYIKSKNINEYNIKNTFKGLLEYLIMGWVVTSPENTIGFDVNYNNE